MFDFTGRVAVITGGSVGLGRGAALALAKQGADIVIMARRKEKLDACAEEIRALGRKCLPIVCDVKEPDQIKAAVEATIAEFGKVDILINNAGGGECVPIVEMPDEMYLHDIYLELVGTFRCTRDFGKHMLERGYGRIINVASILGTVGLSEIPCCNYQSAKGGIVNFTRSAANEWATKGITVNTLCPGFFPSEAMNEANQAAAMDMVVRNTPMGRFGKACGEDPMEGSELDSAFLFLAAEESSYVTGVTLCVDGGWTCH